MGYEPIVYISGHLTMFECENTIDQYMCHALRVLIWMMPISNIHNCIAMCINKTRSNNQSFCIDTFFDFNPSKISNMFNPISHHV